MARDDAYQAMDGLAGGVLRLTLDRRILRVDAPLSPFRTGRQPGEDDRTSWPD
jgi:hypothetical protein